MSSSTEIDAEVGSTANSYEILAKLATGGMAELFLARGVGAVGVKRYVVLKRILREFAGNKSFVRMFLDEATLVSQLQHPNIAQVHDVGKLGESYFFTMEYVHGETVRALLQHTRAKKRELSLASVLAVVAGAAAGLHHAHERIGVDGKPLNIVHRDVTPSNLMVSFEGNVKVVDFGVAKARDRRNDTSSGTIKGKTAYLSPEQCKGAELDRRSDLFSLGIVMWEMLTTDRLFARGSEFDTMSAIVNEDAPALSTRRADIPADIDAIVRRLLARDPADRYATAGELVEALEDAAAHHKLRLSASTLAKVLRETFGERPEPWSFLETQQTAVTVTVTTADADQEARLKKLPGLAIITDDELDDDDDLAIPRAPVVAVAPVKSSRMRAVVEQSDGVMAVMEDQPTARWSVVAPMPELDEISDVIPPPEPVTMPSAAPVRPSQQGRLALPLAPDDESIAPPQAFARGTRESMDDERHDDNEVEMVVGEGEELPAPRVFTGRHLVVAGVLGGAVILGVVAAIAMVRGGNGDRPGVADATAVAQVVVHDAALAVAPDAAIAIEPAIVVDAGAALAVDAAAAAHPVVADKPPPPSKPRISKADLTKTFEAANYPAVVQSCRGGAVAIEPSLCVLAACRVGDAAHAKQWYQAAPAKRRAALIQSCMSLGVALVGTGIPRADP